VLTITPVCAESPGPITLASCNFRGSLRDRETLGESRRRNDMKKLFAFLGSTIGGYIGWYLGSPIGFMSAFVLSMLGTGLGIYAGYRAAQNYE